MNLKHLRFLFSMLALLAITVFTVAAGVISTRTAPEQWVDLTGTNFVGISSASGAPFVVTKGTNVYTAIVSTNLAFLHFNGTGGTNTLVIRNGLIVDIQ
jgi:hypothetical protein